MPLVLYKYCEHELWLNQNWFAFWKQSNTKILPKVLTNVWQKNLKNIFAEVFDLELIWEWIAIICAKN